MQIIQRNIFLLLFTLSLNPILIWQLKNSWIIQLKGLYKNSYSTPGFVFISSIFYGIFNRLKLMGSGFTGFYVLVIAILCIFISISDSLLNYSNTLELLLLLFDLSYVAMGKLVTIFLVYGSCFLKNLWFSSSFLFSYLSFCFYLSSLDSFKSLRFMD